MKNQTLADKISNKLKEARINANLNQSELARRLRVFPAYISELESGRRLASLPTIYRWASACGMGVTLEIE